MTGTLMGSKQEIFAAMTREYGQNVTAEIHTRSDHGTNTARDKGFPATDSLKRYLFEISSHPHLTGEETFDLSRKVYEYKDPDAAARLAVSHLTLVVRIAFKYRSMGYDLLDLIQEGNIGLLQSVRRYDPHKGTRFSGYASFWIKAYMTRYMMATRSLVTLGKTQEERKLFFRLGRETRTLEARGITPTVELLSRNLGSREEDIADMQIRLSGNVLSLETPIAHSDRTMLLMDTIATGEDVEATVNSRIESRILERALDRFRKGLNQKEGYVLDHRILAEESLTLQEIGNVLGVSRERVRQIEGKILIKLRMRFARGIEAEAVQRQAAFLESPHA
jgi:RNA polymerase sigma-32 factor